MQKGKPVHFTNVLPGPCCSKVVLKQGCIKVIAEGKCPMKKERYRLVILLIACIAMFSPNYAQYQLSPLAPCLMTDLGISNTEFASIFSAPMIPAIFLSLGAGILVDRFGAKKSLGLPC